MIVKSGPLAVLGACALVAVALGVSARIAVAAEAAILHRALPRSNTALLLDALRGASAKLARQVPVTPGSRVVVDIDGDGALPMDARQALLEALTARRIEVVLGGGGAAPSPDSAAPAAVHTTASNPAGAPSTSGQLSGITNAYDELQRARREQAARAAASADPDPATPPAATGGTTARAATTTGAAANGQLPRLALRVEEARIDYVRQYRGGLLGAYRVERRATARLDMRLSAPGSDAVTWTASADSSLGDVVLRSDLPSLESKLRAETQGTLPQAGFKKVLEPVLVVALVAGLVSLFYQNRP